MSEMEPTVQEESPEEISEDTVQNVEKAIEEGVVIFGEAPVIPVIEAALMAAGKPLTLEHIAALFDEDARPDKPTLKQAMDDLGGRCEGRGFELKEIASGWRFQVRQELAPWVGRLWDEKPQRYTRALLETLALVAYRQPITRGEIEDIRGVSVSTNIVRTLQEREWVRIVGHRDVPGRPAMYATTRQFLDYFNLRNLDELPPLSELRDLDAMAKKLEAGALGGAIDGEAQEGEQSGQALLGNAEESSLIGQEVAEEVDASSLVSIEEAQAFQDEGNENVEKLFSELDAMEGDLTMTYTDYNPLEQEVPVLEDRVSEEDTDSSSDDISDIMDEISAPRADTEDEEDPEDDDKLPPI